jgi:hypothetical protein
MSRDVGARRRGYAWFVYPDPGSPGPYAGDTPFGGDEPEPAAGRPGITGFWAVGDNATGLSNTSRRRAYLVLTEALDAPEVDSRWVAEPARLREDFAIEQRGGRWVRLVRVLGRRQAGSGEVVEAEFEVDWT